MPAKSALHRRAAYFDAIALADECDRLLLSCKRPVVVHRKVSGGARSDWGARARRSDVQLTGNSSIAEWRCDRDGCVNCYLWLVAVLPAYSPLKLLGLVNNQPPRIPRPRPC